jgi:transcription antitermination factor NusG
MIAAVSQGGQVGLHPTETRWFAVRVPFRREKSVQAILQRKGVESYVPLIPRTRRYVRKIKKYEVPLINNYVFVCITAEEYIRVLETPDVVGFLEFGGQKVRVSEEEMDTLHRIVGDANEEVEIKESHEWLGENVEIIHGQLTGLKGRVVDLSGKHNVLVHLESLGLTLGIQVPVRYLHPLP